jgi:hypothetical protein
VKQEARSQRSESETKKEFGKKILMKYAMIKRIALQLVIICTVTLSSFGQNVVAGFEIQEIIRISEVYRKLPYLSFNATYQYADSAAPTVIKEQIAGQYKIHEGRYWAMLDSTELVQGYNYKLTVYHDQKFLVVGRPDGVYSSVTQLPLLDSLFNARFVDSIHVYTVNDSTNRLEIEFKHDSPFRYYETYYNPVTYMVDSLKYYQKDTDPEEGASGTSVITVTFSSYSSAVIDEEYFRESKFIYRNEANFYPKEEFSEFELIATSEF